MYLAFRQDMGLFGIWLGLTIALVSTSVVGGLIILRADWDHEVKKVMERLESDRDMVDDEESAESA
jgi:MATE family multidrug resistance protein